MNNLQHSDYQANRLSNFCTGIMDIGKEIEKKSKELRIGSTQLAKMVNTTKQNIHLIFKKKSIDTDLLVMISKALNFDFFQLYRVELGYVTDNSSVQLAQEEESIYLRKQNRILIDVIEEKMKPPSIEKIVSMIVVYNNQKVTLLLKDGRSIFGYVYLNKTTGQRLDDLKGVFIVPPKGTLPESVESLIQDMYNSKDPLILEMHAEEMHPVESILNVIPEKPII